MPQAYNGRSRVPSRPATAFGSRIPEQQQQRSINPPRSNTGQTSTPSADEDLSTNVEIREFGPLIQEAALMLQATKKLEEKQNAIVQQYREKLDRLQTEWIGEVEVESERLLGEFQTRLRESFDEIRERMKTRIHAFETETVNQMRDEEKAVFDDMIRDGYPKDRHIFFETECMKPTCDRLPTHLRSMLPTVNNSCLGFQCVICYSEPNTNLAGDLRTVDTDSDINETNVPANIDFSSITTATLAHVPGVPESIQTGVPDEQRSLKTSENYILKVQPKISVWTQSTNGEARRTSRDVTSITSEAQSDVTIGISFVNDQNTGNNLSPRLDTVAILNVGGSASAGVTNSLPAAVQANVDEEILITTETVTDEVKSDVQIIITISRDHNKIEDTASVYEDGIEFPNLEFQDGSSLAEYPQGEDAELSRDHFDPVNGEEVSVQSTINGVHAQNTTGSPCRHLSLELQDGSPLAEYTHGEDAGSSRRDVVPATEETASGQSSASNGRYAPNTPGFPEANPSLEFQDGSPLAEYPRGSSRDDVPANEEGASGQSSDTNGVHGPRTLGCPRRNNNEETDTDSATTLPCFHRFHTACIDQWLQSSTTCPTCRSDIGALLQKGCHDGDGVYFSESLPENLPRMPVSM